MKLYALSLACDSWDLKEKLSLVVSTGGFMRGVLVFSRNNTVVRLSS